MLNFFSPRGIYGLGMLASVCALAYAFYLQYAQALLPCILCELQRLMLGGIIIVYLFAMLFPSKPLKQKIYCVLITIFSLAGILLAGRQIYLQHVPSAGLENCSASLSYLLNILPLNEALKTAITGSSECGEITWQWLGMTLPEWTLGLFVFLGLWSIIPCRKKN